MNKIIKLRYSTLIKYRRIQDIYRYLSDYKLEIKAKEEVISALFSYQFNKDNGLTRLLSQDTSQLQNLCYELDKIWADAYVSNYFRPKK
jgi:hypothetical protein